MKGAYFNKAYKDAAIVKCLIDYPQPIIAKLKRMQFGRRAEKLELQLEELHTHTSLHAPKNCRQIQSCP